MSQKIKHFWLKFVVTFLTIYITPLTDNIFAFFGFRGLGAVASTLKCGTDTQRCNDNSQEIINMSRNQTKDCTCPKGKLGTEIYKCEEDVSSGDLILTWVSGVCRPECTSGQTQSCSTSIRQCVQTCGTDGAWGEKQWLDCNSGYVMVDDICYGVCSISEGVGYDPTIYSSVSSSSQA